MKRSIKSNMLGTLLTDSAVLLLGILTGILAARFLLPDGRGALAAVLFWPQLLAAIGFMSLNEASAFRIGIQPERASVITASSFWVALGLASLTTLVGYILVPFLLGERRAHLWTLTRIYLLYIPFNFLALGLLASVQGKLDFTRYNLIRFIVPLLYMTGILTLWVTDYVTVAGFVVANCAASVLVAILCLVLVKDWALTSASREEMLALVRSAARFHPTTVLLLLASQVDQFSVLAFWDDAVFGQYVVALVIASSGPALISGVFYKVLFPHLANVHDTVAQIGLLARGVRHATLLITGLSFPLAVLIPWLVPSLFGSEFENAVGPACVLLAVQIIAALNTMIIQSLRGFDEGNPGTLATAISVGLFLLLAWPFGNQLGLVGIGAALGVANIGALAYLVNHISQRFNLRVRDLWGLTPRTLGEVWSSASSLNVFVAK